MYWWNFPIDFIKCWKTRRLWQIWVRWWTIQQGTFFPYRATTFPSVHSLASTSKTTTTWSQKFCNLSNKFIFKLFLIAFAICQCFGHIVLHFSRWFSIESNECHWGQQTKETAPAPECKWRNKFCTKEWQREKRTGIFNKITLNPLNIIGMASGRSKGAFDWRRKATSHSNTHLAYNEPINSWTTCRNSIWVRLLWNYLIFKDWSDFWNLAVGQ